MCLLLLVAPALTVRSAANPLALVALAATIVTSLFTANGALAYLAAAVTALLHAATAAARSRTGASTLALAAALHRRRRRRPRRQAS